MSAHLRLLGQNPGRFYEKEAHPEITHHCCRCAPVRLRMQPRKPCSGRKRDHDPFRPGDAVFFCRRRGIWYPLPV